MRVENNYPVTSIGDNQAFFGLEGTYVDNGWAVTVGESGSGIELEVDAGKGFIEGTAVSTTAGVVELPPGDPDYPRRDLVYISTDGTLAVLMGNPAEPARDEDGNALGYQNAPEPAPPDASNLTGIPICHVWVPPAAENTSDLIQDHIFDIRLWVGLSGGTDQTTEKRYATIGPADLSEADDYAEAPLTVSEGDTIRVIEWGAVEVDGGVKREPPVGVRVGLYDPGGVAITTEETGLTRNENGIVEETATNTGANYYSLRLTNNSSQTFDPDMGQGLGAQFVVEIER